MRQPLRRWLGIFLVGLILSGATAMILPPEVHWLAEQWATMDKTSALAHWLQKVDNALQATQKTAPFLYYGTDWLAFGHFMLALVFFWAWREPVRYRGLFDFGLLACLSVLPFAFLCGALRDIPWWWRLVDCSFGILGAIPLWFCRRLASRLENEPRL